MEPEITGESFWIRAATWFDARAFAERRFLGAADVVAAPDDTPADFEIEYRGDDYAHGSGPGGKRLYMRERRVKRWSPWQPA